MRNSSLSVVLRIIIIVIAWFGLGLQQYILIDNTPGSGLTLLQAVGRFFNFFTILSNLLVAISLTIVLVSPGAAAGRFFAKPSVIAAIAVYIFIVGLVYNSILRYTWHPTGRDRVADELLHVAVPVLYIVYWLAFAPKGSLQWKSPFYWLVFPALYIIYALIRGAAEGFYPYPFINVTDLGYGKVALNSAGLMLVFIIAGMIIVAIGKWISRSRSIT